MLRLNLPHYRTKYVKNIEKCPLVAKDLFLTLRLTQILYCWQFKVTLKYGSSSGPKYMCVPILNEICETILELSHMKYQNIRRRHDNLEFSTFPTFVWG